MAIVKVKFRPDADGTGGTVCYQIIHNYYCPLNYTSVSPTS